MDRGFPHVYGVFPSAPGVFPQPLSRMRSQCGPAGELRKLFNPNLTGSSNPASSFCCVRRCLHQCSWTLGVSRFLGLGLQFLRCFDGSPLAMPYWLHQRSDDTARWVRNNSN